MMVYIMKLLNSWILLIISLFINDIDFVEASTFNQTLPSNITTNETNMYPTLPPYATFYNRSYIDHTSPYLYEFATIYGYNITYDLQYIVRGYSTGKNLYKFKGIDYDVTGSALYVNIFKRISKFDVRDLDICLKTRLDDNYRWGFIFEGYQECYSFGRIGPFIALYNQSNPQQGIRVSFTSGDDLNCNGKSRNAEINFICPANGGAFEWYNEDGLQEIYSQFPVYESEPCTRSINIYTAAACPASCITFDEDSDVISMCSTNGLCLYDALIDVTRCECNHNIAEDIFCVTNVTYSPTTKPTTTTVEPTGFPTWDPTPSPTDTTTDPTDEPTINPTNSTNGPTTDPTNEPTMDPTGSTDHPTIDHTDEPSTDTTDEETTDRTDDPTTTTVSTAMSWIIIVIACVAVCLVTVGYIIINKMRSKALDNVICNALVVVVSIGSYNSDTTGTDIQNLDFNDLPVEKDVYNIQEFCSYFNYKLIPQKLKLHWTEKQLISYLGDGICKELLDDTELRYDGLIVFITCHGIENNIVTSDLKTIENMVIHRIISLRSPKVREIPRIYVFDACNGQSERIHVRPSITEDMDKGTKLIDISHNTQWTSTTNNPDYKLVSVYASTQGFQAKMCVRKGSYLTSKFTAKIMKNVNEKENKTLATILDEIQNELHDAGKQQTINILNNNTRHLRFKINHKGQQTIKAYTSVDDSETRDMCDSDNEDCIIEEECVELCELN
eukprot:430580_1